MQSKPNRLPFHEWFAALLLLSTIASIAAFSYLHREPWIEGSVEEGKVIQVRVIGAVERPGWIEVRRGTRLNELQGLVRLADNADLSSLKKGRRLKNMETIEVFSDYGCP